MSVDQQFNIINEKLQQLVKQYNRLQKENERLKSELQEARLKDLGHQEKIDALQQQPRRNHVFVVGITES